VHAVLGTRSGDIDFSAAKGRKCQFQNARASMTIFLTQCTLKFLTCVKSALVVYSRDIKALLLLPKHTTDLVTRNEIIKPADQVARRYWLKVSIRLTLPTDGTAVDMIDDSTPQAFVSCGGT
jgi:hypothetical protein